MVKYVVLAALFTVGSGTLAGADKQAVSPAPTGIAIPAGTTLHCRLTQTLSTKLNAQGDLFTATVSEPLVLEGREAVPVGATLEGRIAWLAHPGRIKGVGEMRLTAERLTLPQGGSFPVGALLLSAYGAEGAKVSSDEGIVRGPSSRFKSFEEISALAGAGGVVGLLFAHPVLGMAVGGAAGFVDRARRRGADLSLPQGTQLNYQLTRELVIEK